MPNVRGITTLMERVRDMFEADAALNVGGFPNGYLKSVYVHQNSFWTKVPNVAAPCIVLNDNGEPIQNITGSRGTNARVVRRTTDIELTVLIRYPQAETVLIGSNDADNVNSLGIIDFSHLVENAINAKKQLTDGNGVPYVDTCTYTGWKNVEIEQDKLFMVGRQFILSYLGFQEVL